jgi:hypothetical protein
MTGEHPGTTGAGGGTSGGLGSTPFQRRVSSRWRASHGRRTRKPHAHNDTPDRAGVRSINVAKAQALNAATALAKRDPGIAGLAKDMADVKRDVVLLKWRQGANFALMVAVFVKLSP